ncbi:helix-turn-helix transcriptional regulator [Bacillus sp. CLL-7-23]|uniref:Helix-turn-helix transcriptional regulator n=1 Tax=Bacillus changyiensis TaxID=3004103 RepID=A0ABT4XB00_9BACI|nr:helix-turn-helix transcriptional regulator [Bacillus changyiensis]MDA7028657.1 helix-turn-helix transcriptional regulator [Bacillus changyiensis]
MFNLEFVKSRRNSKQIKLQHMANALGFKNASTYMKYENGEYSFKANHLPVLATELECEISDFFNIKVAKTAIGKDTKSA